MRKHIRHISAFALAVIMTLALAAFPAAPALALRFGDVAGAPSDLWAVSTPYNEAVNANDAAAITANGEKLMEYWFKGKTAQQCADEWSTDVLAHGWEINQIWSVSKRVAGVYESNGDLDNAIRVYKIALAFVDPYKSLIINEPQLQGNPEEMEFSRQEINAKLDAYEVSISLYAEVDMKSGTGDTSYTGAKHEPKAGAYYGELVHPHSLMDLPQKPSSMIIYAEYENYNLPERVEHDLRENESLGYDRNDYSAIEIAWNFKNEGSTPASVVKDTDKVTEAAEFLKELGLPILLRVGAEMNVWKHEANPAEYIAAFRFIADIMHSKAPNVAMVWSVNFVSNAGLTFDMFYPGQNYVDWVGVSLYTLRYFNGNPNTLDHDAAIWGTGKFANPVRYIGELVEQYGSRHPIMIAEGAVPLVNKSNGEDLTQWALPRMRQVYAYIPLLYPQVKMMIWFNRGDIDPQSNFSLSSNQTAKNLYSELTSSGYFIEKGASDPKITYKKLGTATFPSNAVTLLTYAPFFTLDDVTIQYQLNGSWAGQSTSIPYRSVLDLSGEADGDHTLTVRVLWGGSVLKSENYKLNKNGATVTVSGGETSSTDPGAKPDAGSAPNLSSANDWAHNSINEAYNEGLLPPALQSGYKNAATRAEFCALAVTLYEKVRGEITGRVTFDDTEDVNVQKAAAIEVVNGVGDGRFAPNELLSREQAATMLSRLASAIGKPLATQTVTFSDSNEIAPWAAEAVGQMQATGVMGGIGDNAFAPKSDYTKEQSIITIVRLYNIVK